MRRDAAERAYPDTPRCKLVSAVQTEVDVTEFEDDGSNCDQVIDITQYLDNVG